MSATKTATVTVDRDRLIRFLEDVDAAAVFEKIRAGRCDTFLATDYLYRVIGEFESEVLGPERDSVTERRHKAGWAKGEALWSRFVEEVAS